MILRFIFILSLVFTIGQNIFSQQHIYSVEFADAIIDRYPDNINDFTRKGWEYSNSIILTGISRVYEETGNEKYLNYIQTYVDRYVDDSGNVSFNKEAYNLDHIHPANLLITLYDATGEEKYHRAADTMREQFNSLPTNTLGGFWHKAKYSNQMWADGIYMAEPFLMRYGATFDDLESASDIATNQAILLADHAYDSSLNLLYHAWDESGEAGWADSETGVSPEVWSRGMGWYCMALIDILDYLPETHANYSRLVELVQGLAKGIKEYQDESSGLWYQVVNKGTYSGNWLETSGSCMFVYMLKRALDKGYIGEEYQDVIDKGWEGLKSKITYYSDELPKINDFVWGMGVQSSYSAYVSQSSVDAPGSSYPHGYCGIMLAAWAMETPYPAIVEVETQVEGNGEITGSPKKFTYFTGDTIEFTAEPDNGWEFDSWSLGTTETENIVNISLVSDTTIIARFIESVTSIKEEASEKISLYPSVVNDNLYIKLTDKTNLQKLCIYSSSGKLITCIVNENNNTGSDALSVNVQSLSPGIYTLVLFSDSLSSFRFIKK